MSDVEKYTDARQYLADLKSGAISFIDDANLFDHFLGGQELLTGEAVDLLNGVPFAVVSVTFREGYTREVAGVKAKGDYASLEIVIGDEKALKRAGVKRDEFPFEPLDVVRFNDGGTGVRRQIVAYLAMKGVIELQEGLKAEDISTFGKLGESDCDIPVSMWHHMHAGDVRFDTDGGTVFDYTFDRPLIVSRGLRSSEYENENGRSVTRYFA